MTTLMTSPTRYGVIARTLHWTMATLILVGYVLGDSVGEALHHGDTTAWTVGAHTGIGIALVGLLIVRMVWRKVDGKPAELPTSPSWELKAARWTHYALYAVMAIVPLSGLAFGFTATQPLAVSGLGWAGITQVAPLLDVGTALHRALGEFHEATTSVLVGVVGLHVAATLWHSFVRRDGVAARMIPFARS